MTDSPEEPEEEWIEPEPDAYQSWADSELLLDYEANPEEFRLPPVCLSGNGAYLRVAKG